MPRLLIVVVIVLFLVGGGVSAQGSAIGYNSPVIGTISAQSPLAVYFFTGAAGDLVTIHVAAISPGLDPALALNDPGGVQLARADGDPFGASASDARLDYQLPTSGVYLVIVSAMNATAGDFLLRVNGQPAPAAIPVSDDQPGQAAVDSAQGQTFAVSGPAAVTIAALDPAFAFSVIVRDANGAVIAVATSTGQPVGLSIGPGPHTLYIRAIVPGSSGQVQVLISDTVGGDLPAPVQTEEASAPDEPAVVTVTPSATSACLAESNSAASVNIRVQPTTSSAIVGLLPPGDVLTIVGRFIDWYAVAFNGGTAWVFSGVVSLSGSCETVPLLSPAATAAPTIAPLLITATASATPTASATIVTNTPTASATLGAAATLTATSSPTASATPPADGTVAPTPTATATAPPPTVAPTSTATATATAPPPTAAPTHTATVAPATAPPDASFNSPLNIPLDSTASSTDFVSYPSGDTEDRVRYDITGMNPNAALSGGQARLILAVSCFGTGTQNLQFSVGGQTFACGQTIVDQTVTYDSRTGTVTITAVGGANTYVQWVLTGTATRIN